MSSPVNRPWHDDPSCGSEKVSSVACRILDEEILRPLRGLQPHPLPPLRREGAFDITDCCGGGGGGGGGWGRVTAAGIFGAEGSSRSGLLCPGADEGLELRCWHP